MDYFISFSLICWELCMAMALAEVRHSYTFVLEKLILGSKHQMTKVYTRSMKYDFCYDYGVN